MPRLQCEPKQLISAKVVLLAIAGAFIFCGIIDSMVR